MFDLDAYRSSWSNTTFRITRILECLRSFPERIWACVDVDGLTSEKVVKSISDCEALSPCEANRSLLLIHLDELRLNI